MPLELITCPKCGTQIPLTNAIKQEIEQSIRAEYDEKQRTIETTLHEREQAIATRENSIEDEVNQRVKQQSTDLEQKAKEKANAEVQLQMKDKDEEIREKTEALAKSQQEELNLRKQQRELVARQQSLELEVQRKLDEGRLQIHDSAVKQVNEEHRMKDAEKDKQIQNLTSQIQQLKTENISQQLQGEVQELELEQMFKQAFPFDEILPVSKGVRGGDIIQNVHSDNGSFCGCILWESKRTQNWSDKWIGKLKDDMREQKAAIAAIVSQVLPKDIRSIGNKEGVWIADFPSSLGLAMILRESMISVARSEKALEGKAGKMELVYKYLSGNDFYQRIVTIVESFVQMEEGLNKEKRAMAKSWSEREQLIKNVLLTTSSLWGDLQGIVGGSLQTIEQLELPSHD